MRTLYFKLITNFQKQSKLTNQSGSTEQIGAAHWLSNYYKINYMNFFNYRSIILLILFLTTGVSSSFSKNNKKTSEKKEAHKNVVNTDAVSGLSKPQAYDKVITADAKSFKGTFIVSKVKDCYYFEIPDSILGRDFQVISRIGKGPAILHRSSDAFAGKVLGNMQIRFTKGPNDKLFINRLEYGEVSADSSANGLYRALKMNSIQPVYAAFDIKAYGNKSVVIDVTDYLNGDLAIMTGNVKEVFQATSFQANRSYINAINAFPVNMDIEAVKTYDANQTSITTQINTNFILLSKQIMEIRYTDQRVGFDSQIRTDFDQDVQRGKKVEFIKKWRLEPRPEDLDRYQKGELVEPAKPIVFYIDPTTPKKWVPYIIKAVNDWQTAFEKAGFKNAIYAKETTMNDSCWNARDGRFNTIVYAPTMTSGIVHNLITDPRSGEIIQATIQINHNTLSVMHDTYLIQAGAIDEKARTAEYSTELMGELLRIVLTGHVGTTLGLSDNAGAASTVPVAKLRDKAWVAKHGISPSIMQDVLFNYVAQPEDKMTESEIFGHIGDYDKWAIFWGYKCFPQMNNPIVVRDYLRKIVADSLSANPRLYYGAAPKEKELVSDPRNQPCNLGNDAVEASTLAIKNLKIIAANLVKWTAKPDELYSTSGGNLSIISNALFNQFSNYLESVTNIFGTYYYNPHGLETSEKVYKYVPLVLQKKSMAFLKAELFDKAPQWILPEATANVMIDLPYNNLIYSFGADFLKRILLDFKRLGNINSTAERFGTNNTYSLVTYFGDLDACVWSELGTSQKVSSYHVALQKIYLDALNSVIDTPRAITNISVIALTRGHLVELKQKIINSLKLITDQNTKDHYRDVLAQINTLTDPKRVVPTSTLPQTPQGQNKVQADIRFWKNESVQF